MGRLVTGKDAGLEVEPGSWSPAAGCLALSGRLPLFSSALLCCRRGLGRAISKRVLPPVTTLNLKSPRPFTTCGRLISQSVASLTEVRAAHHRWEAE